VSMYASGMVGGGGGGGVGLRRISVFSLYST
jgi:hypothetical protein